MIDVYSWITYQGTSGWIQLVCGVLETWNCAGFNWQQDAIFVPAVCRWRWTITIFTCQFNSMSCSYGGRNLAMRWRWGNCGIQRSCISRCHSYSDIKTPKLWQNRNGKVSVFECYFKNSHQEQSALLWPPHTCCFQTPRSHTFRYPYGWLFSVSRCYHTCPLGWHMDLWRISPKKKKKKKSI